MLGPWDKIWRKIRDKRHVPVLEINGRPVRGLKRCAYCGLSETYWLRWSECEKLK
jgi:hypothetical protein